MSRGARPADPQELAQRLRAAGLRRTGPRVAVLDRLTRAAGPVSHGELYEDLEQLGFDRATIYRNLIDLTNAGLVRRTDLGDHVWRYELVGAPAHGGKHHVHLVCSDCGQVSCLPGVKVQVRWASGKPSARDYEVQLKGPCAACAAG